MMKYERLTKSYKGAPLHTDMEVTDGDEIYERLAELEDKIEQGTLIEFNMKLPFKVGDTAYWLNGVPNCIQEYTVLGYIFDYSAGIRIDLGDFQPILFRVFGEKLFASHEEAEKRLKELQE